MRVTDDHALRNPRPPVPFVFSRGTPQVLDGFEMIRDFRAVDTDSRAAGVRPRILADFTPPPADPARLSALQDFVARRTALGGAAPES